MASITDAVSDIVSGYIAQDDFEPDGFGYGLGASEDEAHAAAVEDLPYPLDDKRYDQTERVTGEIGDQQLSVILYTTDEDQAEGSGAVDEFDSFSDDDLLG